MRTKQICMEGWLYMSTKQIQLNMFMKICYKYSGVSKSLVYFILLWGKLWKNTNLLSVLFTFGNILFYYFIFLVFRTAPVAYGSSQARGSNQSHSCQPTPQPQQRRIRAASVTYTTAHGSTGSVTHWARPEIKPASSGMLVRFVSTEPRQELHGTTFLVPLYR